MSEKENFVASEREEFELSMPNLTLTFIFAFSA